MSEQISRWVDGDLVSAESAVVAKRCLANFEERDAFSSYLLIGEVMRNGQCATRASTLRIFDALEKEPTIFAPSAAAKLSVGLEDIEGYSASGTVESWPAVANGNIARAPSNPPATTKNRFSRVNYAIAATASAATIGAVMWVGLQNANQIEQSNKNTVVAQSAPVVQVVAQVPNKAAEDISNTQAINLNISEYLAAHRQVVNTVAILPASRVVKNSTQQPAAGR
jgi:negative regulator of sigma E activity